MITYPTPNSVRSGETRPFTYDWTSRLAEVGATSLISSAWERVSGDIVLGAESMGSTTTAVNVTGGTVDTDSVISNSVVTNLGSRLVEQWHLFTVAGAFSNPLPYYSGVGVAGLSSVSTLTASGTRSFTVSPSNQKVYFACPVIEGMPTITVDDWLVDLLPAGVIAVGAVDYYLLETKNLLTGANVPFVVGV